MMIRFAITHTNKEGVRQLTLANQGRNHYETRKAAEAALKELSGPEGFSKVLSAEEAATLEVRWIDCYESGDATGIWFDTPHSPHEKYGLDQLARIEDALDAMDDTSCLTRADFVDMNKPAVRPLFAAAWDEAKALVRSCGTLRKAANHVSELMNHYREETNK